MPLINCSDCGKEHSDHAAACPNCGCPTQVTKDQAEEQERRGAERCSEAGGLPIRKRAEVDAANSAITAANVAHRRFVEERKLARRRGQNQTFWKGAFGVVIAVLGFALYAVFSPILSRPMTSSADNMAGKIIIHTPPISEDLEVQYKATQMRNCIDAAKRGLVSSGSSEASATTVATATCSR